MKFRIAADSSCDLLALKKADFISVPMTIRTEKTEYIDNQWLDVNKMTEELHRFRGRSFTSCPNLSDWEAAFEGADHIVVFTVTRALSGSYNSAAAAKKATSNSIPIKKYIS